MKIKLNLITLIFCVSFSLTIHAAEKKPDIKKIVVFGDSLSDNGNYLKASKFSAKPMPLEPYFQGHATNGNVWVEFLSKSIGVGPMKSKHLRQTDKNKTNANMRHATSVTEVRHDWIWVSLS